MYKRQGVTSGDLMTQNHPVTNGFSISTVAGYDDLPDVKFSFEDENNKAIEVEGVGANSELIVENRSGEGDVIKLRLDRFPRHGVDYNISYTHQLNKTSGIFNSDGQAVISNSNTPLYITNNLQEVTATVGKLNVHYPPSVPGNFDGNSQDFNEYSEYTAYYYVDITFQRAGTNGNVDITAKYNEDHQYQTEAGHNIHHGLILNSGANSEDDIYEDITRTRIGNINSEGIFTAVELTNGVTGKVLRIELPIAVTGADYQDRYPYDLGMNSLTEYNMDPINDPTILFEDREEKNVTNTGTENYYYINVMDSLGNVVSPIPTTYLTTDNDWGKDSNGDTPSVESIEYKVSYEEGVWVKKLVLTHNHELLSAADYLSFTLTKNSTEVYIDGAGLDDDDDDHKTLIVSIYDQNDPLLTSDITNGNVKLAYSDSEIPSNNTLNWLGFGVEEFKGNDAKTVTLPTGNGNTNPLPPVVQSLSVGSINDTTEGGTNPSFEIPLTWTISGSIDGITYVVEQSTDNGNTFVEMEDEDVLVNEDEDGAIISGLSYNIDYTFRVTATTYEDSDPVTITLASVNGPPGQLTNIFVYNKVDVAFARICIKILIFCKILLLNLLINLIYMDQAIFCGGCFWCTEAIYELVDGVEDVISGYSAGNTENPTYKDVTSGKILDDNFRRDLVPTSTF